MYRLPILIINTSPQTHIIIFLYELTLNLHFLIELEI